MMYMYIIQVRKQKIKLITGSKCLNIKIDLGRALKVILMTDSKVDYRHNFKTIII
jgi:hypothetical protein